MCPARICTRYTSLSVATCVCVCVSGWVGVCVCVCVCVDGCGCVSQVYVHVCRHLHAPAKGYEPESTKWSGGTPTVFREFRSQRRTRLFQQPHGGARPFHQKSTCLTQFTLGPYVLQIWSRDPCPRQRNSRTPPCDRAQASGCLGIYICIYVFIFIFIYV